MLTSLLIVTSIWGTDPNFVFGGELAPINRSQAITEDATGSSAAQVGTFSSAVNATNGGGISANSHQLRAQVVTDDSRFPDAVGDFAPICEDPIVKRLIDEMNPFVPLTFDTLSNYYDPFGIQMGTGSCGPQSYRLGWSTFTGSSIFPSSSAFGTAGSMKIVEWNSNAKYSQVIRPGVLFNGTFWFNAHWWDGPSGIALPGQVDQTSSDLELAFFNEGPWSSQIAFHPQIVESYGGKLDQNAFNFDGRIVVTYKSSAEWSFVGGLAVWDRVNTLFVPHVGAIWTPNSRWEIRALFPRSRVSYFLGNYRGADFWVYGQYEYTAEAWQTTISDPTAYSDRTQITDQRVTAGLRWDSGRYSFFGESGYVFDRQVKFAGATPSFDLGDSAIISCGMRY